MNNVLKVGIATVQQQRERALAIAAGTRKRDADEPTVWFPSMSVAARVLSDENLTLLKTIREVQPESIDALAEALGKQQPNVSRSLHAMEPYGLVRLVKRGRVVTPETTVEHVTIAML
jgi:predicted transcriptional regulator